MSRPRATSPKCCFDRTPPIPKRNALLSRKLARDKPTTMTISHQVQVIEPPVSATMANTITTSTPRAEPPDRRESLELRELQTREDEEQLGYSSPSASSGEEYRVTTRRRSSTSTTVRRAQTPRKGKDPLSRISRFWTRHVTLTVPQRSNRDHFGTLFTRFSVYDMQIPGHILALHHSHQL